MDIYEFIKMDHSKIDHLFMSFEKATSMKEQYELVALICQEILVHTYAEQQTFYQELMKYPKTTALGQHGEKEHKEIEEQIAMVNNSEGAMWKKAVLKLKNLVEMHVKEEESTIFEQAKKVISREEAQVLKEKMQYLKSTYLFWIKNAEDIDVLKRDPFVTKKSPKSGRSSNV